MKTIPGGCYRNSDGTYVDANGKQLKDEQVDAYYALMGIERPGKPKASPVKKAANKTASGK
jgi:hypothetical protein